MPSRSTSKPLRELEPDLVLVWGSGLNQRHRARLRALGLTIYESEIRDAMAIPTTLRRLGMLFGRDEEGRAAAERFERNGARCANAVPAARRCACSGNSGMTR